MGSIPGTAGSAFGGAGALPPPHGSMPGIPFAADSSFFGGSTPIIAISLELAVGSSVAPRTAGVSSLVASCAGSSKSSNTFTSSPDPEAIVIPAVASGRVVSIDFDCARGSPPLASLRTDPCNSSSNFRVASAILSKSNPSPSSVGIAPNALKSLAAPRAPPGSSHSSSGFSALSSRRFRAASSGGGRATPRCHLPPLGAGRRLGSPVDSTRTPGGAAPSVFALADKRRSRNDSQTSSLSNGS
mmetsp:Transcript_53920/g.155713  ORF Transcript_53920/g.155713 Transcript_53920/m.155713 type:complete len:243 (+) Transcript_53920:540-1268(+)